MLQCFILADYLIGAWTSTIFCIAAGRFGHDATASIQHWKTFLGQDLNQKKLLQECIQTCMNINWKTSLLPSSCEHPVQLILSHPLSFTFSLLKLCKSSQAATSFPSLEQTMLRDTMSPSSPEQKRMGFFIQVAQ